MAAYDPLSYHNGSVWPHDTALCIAGAARYGCWDAVDLMVDGALEATRHFEGRPPELFAGVARDRRAHAGGLPVLVLPAGVGVGVGAAARADDARSRADGRRLRRRAGASRPVGVADLSLERLEFAGRPMSVTVQDGRGRVTLA